MQECANIVRDIVLMLNILTGINGMGGGPGGGNVHGSQVKVISALKESKLI